MNRYFLNIYTEIYIKYLQCVSIIKYKIGTNIMHQITCTLNRRLSANRLYGLRVIRESNFQFFKNGAKKEENSCINYSG